MSKEGPSAQDLLNKYWGQSHLPINPYVIAVGMGIRVSTLPESLNDLSGRFISPNRIEYNDNDPRTRQRFTIAHELGHFVLDHDDNFRDPRRNFTSEFSDPREIRANDFAADLIMPKGYATYLYWVKKVKTLSKLANMFGVSKLTMAIRLKKIDLI